MKGFFSRLHDSQTGHSKSALRESYKFWTPSTDTERAKPIPDHGEPVATHSYRPHAEKRGSSRPPKPVPIVPAPTYERRVGPTAGPSTEKVVSPPSRPTPGPSQSQYTYVQPTSKATSTRPNKDIKAPPPPPTTGPSYSTRTWTSRDNPAKSHRYEYAKHSRDTPTRDIPTHEIWLPPNVASTSKQGERKNRDKNDASNRYRQHNEEREPVLDSGRRERTHTKDRGKEREERIGHHGRDRERDERARDWERERERERVRERERERDLAREEHDRVKARERERERERETEKEREKEREREREKDRDREKEKERERKKEAEREREKEKVRDREREREREREMEKERDRDREKDRERYRERERERDRGRDRYYDKERREREKERERERNRPREQELEREKGKEIPKAKTTDSLGDAKLHQPQERIAMEGGRNEARTHDRKDRDGRTTRETQRLRERDQEKYRAEATDEEHDRRRLKVLAMDRDRRKETNQGWVSDNYTGLERRTLRQLSTNETAALDEGDSSDNSVKRKSGSRPVQKRSREVVSSAKIAHPPQNPPSNLDFTKPIPHLSQPKGVPLVHDTQPPTNPTPHRMPVHLPPRESNDQSVPHVWGSVNTMDVNETEVPMRREINRLKLNGRHEDPGLQLPDSLHPPEVTIHRRPPSRTFTQPATPLPVSNPLRASKVLPQSRPTLSSSATPSTSRFPGNHEEVLPPQTHVEKQKDYRRPQDYVPEPPSTRPGVPFNESPKLGNNAQGPDFPPQTSQAPSSRERNHFPDSAPAFSSSIPHVMAPPPINEYGSASHLPSGQAKNIQHEKTISIQPVMAPDSFRAVPDLQATLPSSHRQQESTLAPVISFPNTNLSEINQANNRHIPKANPPVIINQSTPIRATQPLESQLSPGFSMQRPSTVTGYKSSSKQYHPSSTSGGTFNASSFSAFPGPSDSPKRLSSSETQIHGDLISNHQDLPTSQVFHPSRDTHYDQALGTERQPNPSFPNESHPRSHEWPTPEVIGASITRPSTSTGSKQDYAGKTPRHQGLSITLPNTIESAQAHPMSHTNGPGSNRMLAQKDISPGISSRQHVAVQNLNPVKEEQLAGGAVVEHGSQFQGPLARPTVVSMQKKESPRIPMVVADHPIPASFETQFQGPLDRPTMVSVMKKESPRAPILAGDSATLVPENIETRVTFHPTNKQESPNLRDRGLKLVPALNLETSNSQTYGAPEQKQESPASGRRTPLNRQSQLPNIPEVVHSQPTKFIKQDSPRMHGEIRMKNPGVRSSPLSSRDDLQYDPAATLNSKYDSHGANTASRKQSNDTTYLLEPGLSSETHKIPTTGWSNAITAPQIKSHRNLSSTMGPRHDVETQPSTTSTSGVLPGNSYSQHEQPRSWAPAPTDTTDNRIVPLPLTTISGSGLLKSSEVTSSRFEAPRHVSDTPPDENLVGRSVSRNTTTLAHAEGDPAIQTYQNKQNGTANASLQTHSLPSPAFALGEKVKDNDPPSLGFFTKTFTAVLSTTGGERRRSPLEPIQNLAPEFLAGSFPPFTNNDAPPKSVDVQLEIHQRAPRFSQVEQGHQMPPPLIVAQNSRTETQSGNALRSDVSIMKKEDRFSRAPNISSAAQPTKIHHPVLAEILSSPPPRTDNRGDVAVPSTNPSDSHQRIGPSSNVKPTSEILNYQHRTRRPETETTSRPQPPQRLPESQGRPDPEQPQAPSRTLNTQANSQARLVYPTLSTRVPSTSNPQLTVHKQDSLPRTEMLDSGVGPNRYNKEPIPSSQDTNMSAALSYQREKTEDYSSYKPTYQAPDKYGIPAQSQGPQSAGLPSGLSQLGRHRHSASLPTSFTAPPANFPSKELPRSATPTQNQFSLNTAGVLNPTVHNSTPKLAATASEETILMTPSSLAQSTTLKPTISRQSMTPSVSSQTGRKTNGGIFSMFRKTSAQATQPPPQYEIWHPTVPTPNSSPGDPNMAPPNTAPVAAIPTPPSAPQEPAPIAIPVHIHGATKQLPHNSNVYTPFRFLRSRKPRAISLASLEAQDGTAPNTVVGSPTASMHSQAPPIQPPPERDNRLATEEWRNREEAEAEVRARVKLRRQPPGVVFDVDEETPGDIQRRPRRMRTRYRRSSKPPESEAELP